jgi:hypothetical protein
VRPPACARGELRERCLTRARRDRLVGIEIDGNVGPLQLDFRSMDDVADHTHPMAAALDLVESMARRVARRGNGADAGNSVAGASKVRMRPAVI